MWRQVALPVMGVAVSWLAVSGSTNFYLQWLEGSYQQVFNQNVASMHAASAVQQEVWQLHAEVNSSRTRGTDWRLRLARFDADMHGPLTTLQRRADTAEEAAAAAAVRTLAQEYRAALEAILLGPHQGDASDTGPNQDRLFELADRVSAESDRISEINDTLLEAANARRTRISRTVLWARSLAITLVPALGIGLGWWTATRLQRTVTQIQVTLHDPALHEPGLLGTVQVGRGSDLASIHKQVEVVVDRLRRTGDELQAARQEVVRSERLAAIGGLAAGVAHELRNPLTSVKLLLQHAAGHSGAAVIAAPRIELILDEIERMETTIQGLLDFSRPGRPQRRLHDIRETVQRALHLVEGRAEEQHVMTNCRLGDVPIFVDGDSRQLHQVFVNLLINAIEAMPTGGNLSVTLTSDPASGWLTVRVQDTGVGIPDDLMPRLFEPFATAKERGTGLGLAVSRRIVEEHGGLIAAHHRSPQGTVLEVRLPAAANVPAELAGTA